MRANKKLGTYGLRKQELIVPLRTANDFVRRMQYYPDEMQQYLHNSRPEVEYLKAARASVNDTAVGDLEQVCAGANSLRRRCT